MAKLFKTSNIWIGTIEKWEKLQNEFFDCDIYIVIDETGNRILKKCRY